MKKSKGINLERKYQTLVWGKLRPSNGKIETLITTLEGAINKEDYSGMKDTMETLKKAVMEVGEKAYQDAGASNPADDVIETDFSSEK